MDARQAGLMDRPDVRWVREPGDPFPPEVRLLGYDAPRSALSLEEHVHDDAYEFVIMEKGLAHWRIGNEELRTRSGDVLLTRPGVWHRGLYEVIEPCTFWWIQLAARQHANWLHLDPAEAELLEHALNEAPAVRTCGKEILQPLRRLRQLAEATHPAARLEARISVMEFLLPWIHVHESSSNHREEGWASAMQRVVEQLHAAPEERFQVAEQADRLGISVSYFHKLFRDYTGLSPIVYRDRLRFERACEVLTQGQPVTKVAIDLGFASSQQFATFFRRMTGQSPTAWKRRGQHANTAR